MIPLSEYKRALRFLRPHWKRFVPLVFANFISNAVTLAQPYLTKLLIDNALTKRSFLDLEWFALWMGICAALSFGLGILTTAWYTNLSARVLFDMRLTAFRKLQRLSPQFFAGTKTGDLVSRLNNDIGELQRLSSDTLLSLPSSFVFLVGNAMLMLYLDPRLSMVGFGMLPAAIWAMRRYQGRLRQQVQTLREHSADIGSFLIEAILGIRLLVGCNAQRRKDEEFRLKNEDFVRSLMAMQTTSFMAGALPGAVITLSVAVIFLYGGSLVIAGTMTIGSLMAFMAYHGKLLSPIQGLMSSYSALITGSVSLGRVFELLDKPEEVVETTTCAMRKPTLRGELRIEDVSFRYKGRDAVLRGVSFQVPAFSTCVVVGASGAGKSTLLDLLLRFYDPSAGRIVLDGIDLRDFTLHQVRDAISIVDQTPFFFHASIRENLLFANPNASAEQYQTAADLAGIHEFIQLLPDGYQTVLGERGLMLSVGQRQRLAIARSLLRRPSVLVLDEPSAALDPNAEFALCQTLRKLSATCTVIIATHKPAMVEIADQVVVLEQGRIVEARTPKQILEEEAALVRPFHEASPGRAAER